MKLIIGLGNPEPDYSNTRHNAGKDILNLFAKTNEATFNFDKSYNLHTFKLSNKSIIVKPDCYMNESGLSIAKIINFYKLDHSDVMVLYDELDIILGEYKLCLGKGSNIHNGIVSLYNALGAKDFWHLRIGVRDENIPMSVKKEGIDPKAYVLEKLSITDRNKLIYLYETKLEQELLRFLGT